MGSIFSGSSPILSLNVGRKNGKFVLINGEELAASWFSTGSQCANAGRHEFKRINEDYCDQEAL